MHPKIYSSLPYCLAGKKFTANIKQRKRKTQTAESVCCPTCHSKGRASVVFGYPTLFRYSSSSSLNLNFHNRATARISAAIITTQANLPTSAQTKIELVEVYQVIQPVAHPIDSSRKRARNSKIGPGTGNNAVISPKDAIVDHITVPDNILFHLLVDVTFKFGRVGDILSENTETWSR